MEISFYVVHRVIGEPKRMATVSLHWHALTWHTVVFTSELITRVWSSDEG